MVAILAVVFSAACGISTPSNNTVDQVSGTVPVGGNVLHSFTASKAGEVEVTITSLTPPPNGTLAMTLGQQAGTTCSLIPGYVSAVVVNRVVQFGSLNKGSYCLIVYDPTPSVLTVPASYTGRISHP